MTQKYKILQLKITVFLSLGLYAGGPSYRRIFQPLKENIPSTAKHDISTIFFLFCESFLPSRIWIQPTKYQRGSTAVICVVDPE
jgi:hypothetical protein